MAKSGTKTKATKKRKFTTITVNFGEATLERLNAIADLSATTISQTVSVILACYICEVKEIKGEGFKVSRSKKQLKQQMFGLGDKG